MTGFNLPPGCSVSDIPGNRPEDELAEAIADGWRPRCASCGGFLKLDGLETRTEDDEWRTCVEFRRCRRCGHETIEFAGPTIDPEPLRSIEREGMQVVRAQERRDATTRADALAMPPEGE